MSNLREARMMTLEERLWSKVDRRGDEECWPWIGGLSHGKPNMNIDRTSVSPRKVAWELTHGERPPKERHVEVSCGNSMCMNPAHLVYQTIEERFWARVEKGEGCWIWTGRFSTGREYGQFEYREDGRKVSVPAHRFSYELAFGKIEGHVGHDLEREICVCHRCDNPPCVNPEHLFLGSDKDNIRDMISKGRAGWQKARQNMVDAANKAMGVTPDEKGES
jgi:hypothetical protein